jgi:hypothetical protein
MTLLIKDIDVAAPDTSCKLTVGLKVESDRTNCDISDNENGSYCFYQFKCHNVTSHGQIFSSITVI